MEIDFSCCWRQIASLRLFCVTVALNLGIWNIGWQCRCTGHEGSQQPGFRWCVCLCEVGGFPPMDQQHGSLSHTHTSLGKVVVTCVSRNRVLLKWGCARAQNQAPAAPSSLREEHSMRACALTCRASGSLSLGRACEIRPYRRQLPPWCAKTQHSCDLIKDRNHKKGQPGLQALMFGSAARNPPASKDLPNARQMGNTDGTMRRYNDRSRWHLNPSGTKSPEIKAYQI